MNITISTIVFILLSAAPSFDQELPFIRGGVEAPTMVIENSFALDKIKPGAYLFGSFFITVPNGWHVYALGEKKYKPLTFKSQAGPMKNIRFSYPPAQTVTIMGEKVNVYEGRVEVIAEGLISKEAKEGQMVWRPSVIFQSCSDTVCLPPESITLEVVINVGR